MQGTDRTVDVLNRVTFQELEETVAAGIPELMIELIDTYVRDGHNHLNILAAAGDDARQLELSAHSLKSSSATFGAEELADISARIEQLARAGLNDDVSIYIHQAQQQFAKVETALAEERTRLQRT